MRWMPDADWWREHLQKHHSSIVNRQSSIAINNWQMSVSRHCGPHWQVCCQCFSFLSLNSFFLPLLFSLFLPLFRWGVQYVCRSHLRIWRWSLSTLRCEITLPTLGNVTEISVISIFTVAIALSISKNHYATVIADREDPFLAVLLQCRNVVRHDLCSFMKCCKCIAELCLSIIYCETLSWTLFLSPTLIVVCIIGCIRK